MANLRNLSPTDLLMYGCKTSQSAIEVLRFIQTGLHLNIAQSIQVASGIAATPFITHDLVQEALFACFPKWGDGEGTRQFLYHVLNEFEVSGERPKIALQSIAATKGMDGLSSVMMLAFETPQAVIDYIIKRYSLTDKKIYGEATLARQRLLGELIELSTGKHGDIKWNNPYTSAVFAAMLKDQPQVVVELIKSSKDLPQPIVEIILNSDNSEWDPNNPFPNPNPASAALREARIVLLEKHGWWTNPVMIFTMAKQSSNPENIISEYIDSSRVSVDFRIQVLDAALGLGSPLVDNSGNPIQIELSGPQLSKIVCAAARQQVTKIFQVCLNLLRGASTRLSEFIDSLVKELTSNPLALHRMSEVMSLVRQHDKEHRASGQFLSLYYAGMEASKPKP